MKNFKYRSLLFLPLTLLTLSGCKKYTCYCEVILAPNPSVPLGLNSGGSSSFIVKGTKANAKNKCDGHSTKPDSNGDYTKCEIK